MTTPVFDKFNDISCSWNEKEQRYITLAEQWRRKHMSWADLKKLLDSMESLTLANSVECLVEGVRYDMHLYENLVDGTIVLVPTFSPVEEDDVN